MCVRVIGPPAADICWRETAIRHGSEASPFETGMGYGTAKRSLHEFIRSGPIHRRLSSD